MNVQIVSRTEGVGKYEGLTSEEILSAIARHGIIKEDHGGLVRYLMAEKHWSPLDMINFGFEIETSRSIGRQILRHWTIKPQEHSQRYSNRVQFEEVELRKEHPTNRQSSTDIFSPIIPSYPDIIEGKSLEDKNIFKETASIVIEEHLEAVENLYLNLLAAGVAKECAREILPECTTTTMTMFGSLRNWLSFLNVRSHETAQKEIRLIAHEIGEVLEKEMPNVFSKIDWKKGLFM